MLPLTASKVAEIVNGTLLAPAELLVTSEPCFDSRRATQGSIFLALKGEQSDGHDFAEAAIAAGAVLVLSTRPVEVPCIVVSDVLTALSQIAHYVRLQLPDMKVIGITGSQGKTTTKDLLAAILRLVGETVATQASFNNELGLPLTLLRCDETTKFCIAEMGARHGGDIATLCRIAQPDLGVVLKVGTAHIGEFGSREAIASAKAELVRNLKPDGVAILGLYDEFTPHMTEGTLIRTLTFGQTPDASVRATDIDIREGRAQFDLVTQEGRASVALRLVGAHQIANALAAAAVCTELHVPIDIIAVGLSTAEVASKWRMEIHELNNLVLINDAYNANPDSMVGALSTLALMAQERGGQTWAFLGTMHELGKSSSTEHARVGKIAEELGIDHLVLVNAPEYGHTIAPDSAMIVHNFMSQEEATQMWEHFLPGDVILVKASRAERLEVLAAELLSMWQGATVKFENGGDAT